MRGTGADVQQPGAGNDSHEPALGSRLHAVRGVSSGSGAVLSCTVPAAPSCLCDAADCSMERGRREAAWVRAVRYPC
jgi:hypothetical protein